MRDYVLDQPGAREFVDAYGWANFFTGTALIGVPVLLLVWLVGGYIVIRWPEQKDGAGRIVANAGNSVGVLVAFSSYLWLFYTPIMELANSSRMVTRAVHRWSADGSTASC